MNVVDRVDNLDPTPKFLQIARIVREQIRSGDLEPERLIPSEIQMSQIYGVARKTVRMGIRVLAEEGWVITIQSRGTFVAPRDRWPEGE
ncbi:GntR family transcriptional regulator [Planobispora rosea]|uniref:GntR family transcriptional regulator n=1 Tax=Planobispora rosea TaxID=35762 RepID=UPI00083B4B9D|nr:GntR family transcriptional regulator [Planobispora rosea]